MIIAFSVALVLGVIWYQSVQDTIKPKRADVLISETASFNSNQEIPMHGQDHRDLPLATQQKVVISAKPDFPKKVVQAISTDGNSEPAQSTSKVRYVVEDNLVVVNGDIVLGEPTGTATSGGASVEAIVLWTDGIVPFHIQEDVPNKDRIIRAMTYFVDSPIKFVPYVDQEDVLVFEKGGGCRSYLGKIGGKQPLWLSDGCRSKEVAHEIMHALGFIHEQNRPDRDNHVQVVWDNVIEEFRHNFDIFPTSLMKVSGTNIFDFHSIMLYETNAFAKSPDKNTLISLHPELAINPNPYLSAGDRLRLRKVYGSDE